MAHEGTKKKDPGFTKKWQAVQLEDMKGEREIKLKWR